MPKERFVFNPDDLLWQEIIMLYFPLTREIGPAKNR
ncbi:hypothetical protein Hsar01_04005 [Haloferula sargassicola]|uniref:Transposase n=1 Tax=Haloferula sargassicola TaxID=490096 RepID=A0ABP9UZD9_9BACT